MLKDVTLGQFFPGQTPIHKLDPRTKLVLVIVYIVALFLAKWFVSYVVIAAFLAIVIAMSKIRLKVVLKNLKPLLFIIILTALLNLFTDRGNQLRSSGSSKSQNPAFRTPFLWCFAFPCLWPEHLC